MERCDGGDVFKHVCAQMTAEPPVEPDLDFVQLIFEQMSQLGPLPRGCVYFGGQQSHSSTAPWLGFVADRQALCPAVDPPWPQSRQAHSSKARS